MEPVDNIEKLYKNYTILADAKEKIAEFEKEYLDSLAAVKGSSQEKRLASQIISRFFKHFPLLANQAIDAQLDLCEDDDVAIRKQAIKDLPTLCKDNTDNLPKIADVLAQLLQTEDPSELSTVQTSLITLFKIDCKGTLGGLFYQINNGEEVVRDRAIKFLGAKVKTLPPSIFSKDAEELFMVESKKVLQDVTAEEFVTFMSMISSLKLAKTVSGHQQLVQIIADQADLDKDFDPKDLENIDRLMQCIKQAIPYFSSQVNSTQFVDYICSKVLKVLHEVPGPVDAGLDLQLELLKLLAEMSTHCGTIVDSTEKVGSVFNKLLEYMPLPLADENAENGSTNGEPKLEFSYVECLMYAFHQLGKKHPEFLTAEEHADKLKDFKLRLQYFARGSQGYVKKLREALLGKKGDALKSEENKIKVVALKTTSNINTLIRDLFHNPPSYKSVVSLSWKSAAGMTTATTPTRPAVVSTTKSTDTPSEDTTTGVKRPTRTPITFDDGPAPPKKLNSTPASTGSKSERVLYAPPSGKYSNKVKAFTLPPSRGLGSYRRSRGFGYNRGRGRGRGRFY